MSTYSYAYLYIYDSAPIGNLFIYATTKGRLFIIYRTHVYIYFEGFFPLKYIETLYEYVPKKCEASHSFSKMK